MSVSLMTAAFKAALPTTQKFVLVALCDSANDQGECYPSIPVVMGKCSLSDRAVQKAITDLESAGYLRREFRSGRSTVYWLTPERGSPPNDVHPRTTFTPNKVHPTPERGSPQPPNDVHPTPERRSPITVIEPSLETSGNRKKKRASAPDVEPMTADALIAEGVQAEIATEFIALRSRLKAPVTPLAWKGLKREAGKAGWTLDAVLTKCVERKWQGFEAGWVDAGKSARNPQRGAPPMDKATRDAEAMRLLGIHTETIDA